MEGKNHFGETSPKRDVLESKLAAAGWALFFIWMGIALFADVGWGAGLLGVGIITLGIQLLRKHLVGRMMGFWIVVGFFFVLGGAWELLTVQLSLMPIFCIGIGLLLLVSALMRKPGDSVLK